MTPISTSAEELTLETATVHVEVLELTLGSCDQDTLGKEQIWVLLPPCTR